MSKIQPRRTPNTAAQKQQCNRSPPLHLKPTGSSESKNRHSSSKIENARPSRSPLHSSKIEDSESKSRHSSSKIEDARPSRSPLHFSKIEDARPSRSPLHEKQHRTRVAELEAKLREALEELEKLRETLVAVESSKREIQQELEETKIQNRLADHNLKEQEKRGILQELEEAKELVEEKELDVPTPSSLVTDVFEVVPVLMQMDPRNSHEGNEAAEKSDKKMDSLIEENGGLKKELEAVREEAAAVGAKLAALEEELRIRSEFMERQGEHLEAAEGTKAALQEEMKRVCVRSDQWRKAAEAALAALYNGGGKGLEMEGVLMGLEDGRWKGMFGDLWRKKGP